MNEITGGTAKLDLSGIKLDPMASATATFVPPQLMTTEVVEVTPRGGGSAVIGGASFFVCANCQVHYTEAGSHRCADFAHTTYQPAPQPNARPAVQDLVSNDIWLRKEQGIRKYGTALQPFNGRDALVDAYQEALDLVMYLRQAIYERDGR